MDTVQRGGRKGAIACTTNHGRTAQTSAMPSSLLPFLASMALAVSAPPQSVVEPQDWQAFAEAWLANGVPEGAPMLPGDAVNAAEGFIGLLDNAGPAPVQQVRIEQHLVIRIAPRATDKAIPMDAPARPAAPRFRERKAVSCLPVHAIAGVQVADDRLILVMRDRRLIGAALGRACRPRDFYSGFYVERRADGQVCAGRDNIHSRAGATCGISRLRQLVPRD